LKKIQCIRNTKKTVICVNQNCESSSDDGHREVAAILQSPGEWMSSGHLLSSKDGQAYTLMEPRGDPEMAPVYLKLLLPIFCRTFQGSMLSSVRRASLGLIKKIVQYAHPSVLKSICIKSDEATTSIAAQNVGNLLTEVIASVLDSEVNVKTNL